MSNLTCTEYQACDAQISCKAEVFCIQCNSLQCSVCEEEIHQHVGRRNHERLTLDEIKDESCSMNPNHQAMFFCSTCARNFCYECYVTRHRQSDGKKHKPQKSRDGQVQSTRTKAAEQQSTAKPIYPDLSSDTLQMNLNKRNRQPNPSAPKFEDIQLDQNVQPTASPSVQRKSTKTHPMKQEHLANENMFDENRRGSTTENESNGVVFLLDGIEQLRVRNSLDFIRRLQSSSHDPSVKCLSILGNTGDGKSFTLNQVFFDGEEKFSTSPTTDSCTMGVWAALDEPQNTLILDTEGRLGLTQNDNARNRLLLKILCVSDVVIFRTKAPKLPNDMFQFLSDASTAFLKYFKKEIENVMKNCNVDGPVSTMGPTLIIFHETQHTEVLRDELHPPKTAVEQLKERFNQMKLPYEAYSSIEYVGVRTSSGRKTDFRGIKAKIDEVLQNNNMRSRRPLSVIFKALKALNEKFNHAVPPEIPSTLPDDFFTCCARCLACGAKCTDTANHQKEGTPHRCTEQCSYNKELDNEIMKCVQCDREGVNTIVYGKLIKTSDSLVEGFVKYVWSGSVIECPKHGEIFRTRKYWYGNSEPKQETRVEVIHVWPGDDTNRLSSDVTPRKVVEAICSAGSYLSGPTQRIKELVADQIAPQYWVSNQDSDQCTSCQLIFGLEYTKHHCRACGYTFCDTCTKHRIVVPMLDVQTPERVCGICYEQIQSRTLSSILRNNNPQNQGEQINDDEANDNNNNNNNMANARSFAVPNAYNIPMSRRIVDMWKNNVTPIIYTYPIEFIKAGTRPKYWRADNECDACFNCKLPFNSTTRRLHHCRKCGECFCDACSPNKRPVPERGWATAERVCTACEKEIDQSNGEQT